MIRYNRLATPTPPTTPMPPTAEEEEEEEDKEDKEEPLVVPQPNTKCDCEDIVLNVAKATLEATTRNLKKTDAINMTDITDNDLRLATKALLNPNNMTEIVVRHDVIKKVHLSDETTLKPPKLLESEFFNTLPFYRPCMPVVSVGFADVDDEEKEEEEDEDEDEEEYTDEYKAIVGAVGDDAVVELFKQQKKKKPKLVSPHTKTCCLDDILKNTTSTITGTPKSPALPLTSISDYLKESKAKEKNLHAEIAKLYKGVSESLTQCIKETLKLEQGPPELLERLVALATNAAFDLRSDLTLKRVEIGEDQEEEYKIKPRCVQLCQHSKECEALKTSLENLRHCMKISVEQIETRLPFEVSGEAGEKIKKAILGSQKTSHLRVQLTVNPYDPARCLSHKDLTHATNRPVDVKQVELEKTSGVGFVADTFVIVSYLNPTEMGTGAQILTSNCRILTFKPPSFNPSFQDYKYALYPMNRFKANHCNIENVLVYSSETHPVSAIHFDNPSTCRSIFGSSDASNLSLSLMGNHLKIKSTLGIQSKPIANSQIAFALDVLLVTRHLSKVREFDTSGLERNSYQSHEIKVIRFPKHSTLDGINTKHRIGKIQKILFSKNQAEVTQELQNTKTTLATLISSITGVRYTDDKISTVLKNICDLVAKDATVNLTSQTTPITNGGAQNTEAKKAAIEEIRSITAVGFNYCDAIKNLCEWMDQLREDIQSHHPSMLFGDIECKLKSSIFQLKNKIGQEYDKMRGTLITKYHR